MNAFDVFLSRASQISVLRVIYHADDPLSGREIERRAGLSNRATMMALESLVDSSALQKSETSNSYLFEWNPSFYFSKALKTVFDAEDLFWQDFGKAIRRVVHPRPLAAVATGPLAREDTFAAGRVEVTMLFSSGRQRIRAFNTMEHLHDVVWDRYAVTVDPVLLDVNNMNNESYEALWRRVEREGILLFGSLP